MKDRDKTPEGFSRAEEELKKSLYFLQALIDAIPTPIFYKDTRGVYTGCNRAFEKILGKGKDRIIGKTVYDVSPPELAEVYHRADVALFCERQVQVYETEVRYADGTLHNVVFHKAPFDNPDGSLGGLIGVIFDITDRKRAQMELMRSRDLLEKRVAERTADLTRINESLRKEIEGRIRIEKSLSEEKARAELYVDLMGHDISNMDQIAIGYIELAIEVLEKKGKIDDEVRALLDKPIGALRSTSRLIDNVKKLQKERAGRYKPMIVDVGRILEAVKKQYERVPGREVAINYVRASGCKVKANELLHDVFSNLVGNAIKHSRGPLTVTLILERARVSGGSYCRISVEDNGPGIPDDLKKKLFDRLCLYRARAGGKGFGLCLTKLLVDDFGGRFWVEDRVPGDHTKGCRFVVLLPSV